MRDHSLRGCLLDASLATGCPAPPRRFDPVLAMQTLYTPPIGWRNNTDGGRSILFPDYRQA